MAIPSRSLSDCGTLLDTATSQRLMKIDATERISGVNPASMRRSTPRMNALAAVRYCSSENNSVTLTGIPAKIASSIAGRPSGRSDRRCSVVRQKWRYFERDPTIHTTGPVIDRSKQIGGLREVLERKREEQPLCRLALGDFASFRIVVVTAVLDRMIKNGRIGCEPSDRQIVDVAPKDSRSQ